jgi:hypothetical protein
MTDDQIIDQITNSFLKYNLRDIKETALPSINRKRFWMLNFSSTNVKEQKAK